MTSKLFYVTIDKKMNQTDKIIWCKNWVNMNQTDVNFMMWRLLKMCQCNDQWIMYSKNGLNVIQYNN